MGDNDLHEMKHVLECLWIKYENEQAIRTKMFFAYTEPTSNLVRNNAPKHNRQENQKETIYRPMPRVH